MEIEDLLAMSIVAKKFDKEVMADDLITEAEKLRLLENMKAVLEYCVDIKEAIDQRTAKHISAS